MSLHHRLMPLITAGYPLHVVPQDSTGAGYPEKPIRMIVPAAKGGPGYMLARLIGDHLTQKWGRETIVECQEGNTGIQTAARAAPDGYTMLVAGGSYYVNAIMYRSLPFDPVKDFTPVSLIALISNVLTVHPALPANSVDELVAYAKARPGKLRYGSSGHGSAPHLAGELFRIMTGVDIVHVPFHGHLAAGAAVANGSDVQLMFDAMPTALPHIKAGELRGLAVTTSKRAPALPDVPTLSESGLIGYEINPGVGVLAPAGTPVSVVALMSAEIDRIVRIPKVKSQLQNEGADAAGGTPGDFGRYINSALEKWSYVIKTANIPLID